MLLVLALILLTLLVAYVVAHFPHICIFVGDLVVFFSIHNFYSIFKISQNILLVKMEA